MKAKISGIEVEGTIEEIIEFQKSQEEKTRKEYFNKFFKGQTNYQWFGSDQSNSIPLDIIIWNKSNAK